MHDTAPLGKTTIHTHRLGFGGIPIQRLSEHESTRVLQEAVDQGIVFFDTAVAYSDSEEKMGIALKPYRDRIYLATKSMARTASEMETHIHQSLKRLQTDVIDLYQMHLINNEQVYKQVLSPDGAYHALVKARKRGDIKHIGLTTHKPDYIATILSDGIVETVQAPVNYIEQTSLTTLLPVCQQQRIGFIAMKPMGGGAFRNWEANLQFVFHSGVDVAIPGMDTIEQVHANKAVFTNQKPISSDQWKTLEEEAAHLGSRFCRRCEYCMPCPHGLNIPVLLLLQRYYTLYDLKEWALERLATQQHTYKDCLQCGTCESRCPYELPIQDMMQEGARLMD
jgi:uncharacterized protein